MSSPISRRITFAAVLSTSLGGLALTAPQAHATVDGVSSSPLTIDSSGGQMQIGDQAVAPPSGGGTAVAWSPDGSKITYEVGNILYVSNADGTDRIRIGYGSGNGADDRPTFGYDGELVIFSTSGSGHQEIDATLANGADTVGDVDTSQWNLITGTPSGANDIRPDYGFQHIVFERVQGGVSSVLVRSNSGDTTPYKVANGSWPTVSPDGSTVAFVAPDGQGQDQIWTVSSAAPGGSLNTPVQQTFLTSGSHLKNTTFSPDGQSIAFHTVTGAVSDVRTVARISDAGASSNPDTVVTAKITITADSTLSYRTEFKKQVVSLAGADRTATAVATSQQEWKSVADPSDTRRHAQVAVLSRSDTFADALGGAALAAHKQGPLLLTDSTGLDSSVLAELTRMLPQGSTVYLLGGLGALSQAVTTQVQQAGFNPVRIAGPDRYATSVSIAQVATGGAAPDNILVATGNNFPDALSAGAAAAADEGSVVVLTDDKNMPASTGAYLSSFHTDFSGDNDPYLWGVGVQGLGAIDNYSQQQWYRYEEAGATRFDTSLSLAHDFFPGVEAVGFATAFNFPDSLAGGALMGAEYGPLLLVDPATGLTSDEKKYLDDNRGAIWEAFLFGGQVAWSSTIQAQVRAGIQGPLGFVADPAQAVAKPGVAPGAQSATAAHAGVRAAVGGAAAVVKPTKP